MLRYINITLMAVFLAVLAMAAWAAWSGGDASLPGPATRQAKTQEQAEGAQSQASARPAAQAGGLAKLFTAEEAPAPEAEPPEPPQAELTGLVLNQGQALAIVIEGSGSGKVRTLAVGDRLGVWTVAEITTSSMLLTASTGESHRLDLMQ